MYSFKTEYIKSDTWIIVNTHTNTHSLSHSKYKTYKAIQGITEYLFV